jgi:ribosomal protein S18 acetylase RimI-like enzyme
MASLNFEIRSLVAGDAAAFKELRVQTILDSPSAVWPTEEEEAGRTLEYIGLRITAGPDQVVFGAFAAGRLVGIAGLRREPLAQVAHKGFLWGVAVARDYRREGIARQMIERALEHARASGILQVHLAVNTENRRARQLYLSLGFESFGVEPRALRVGDFFYDEDQMVLRLDGARG